MLRPIIVAMEAVNKDSKSRRRNLIMVEVGDDIKQRVTLIAKHNEMSISATTRLLIQKALMGSKEDFAITIRIPEASRLSA